jgi:hypothetical protein
MGRCRLTPPDPGFTLSIYSIFAFNSNLRPCAMADAAGTQAAGPHTDALLAVEEGRRREEVADIKDAAVISTAAVRWGAEVTEWIDGLTFWLRATVMPPLRRQHAAKTAKKKTALNNTVLWSMLDLMWRCIPTECLTSGALKKKHGTFFMDSPPPTELEVGAYVNFKLVISA